MDNIRILEAKRFKVQKLLDAQRSRKERNELGQFATPPALAEDIFRYLKPMLKTQETISFLEPAIGTGSFLSALLQTFDKQKIKTALGFEIDKRFVEVACQLWGKTPLKVINKDFTQALAPTFGEGRFNLLVTNPPYVRHHHLSTHDKNRLHHQVKKLTGYELSRQAGLYCHFLLISHTWMSEGGLACWLIPSEFMDVNYGQVIKEYLLRDVTLLRIHRYEEGQTQFSDALVSSAAVIFRKTQTTSEGQVEFTHGGSITKPERTKLVDTSTLKAEDKWTRFGREQPKQKSYKKQIRLGELFTIKRGLATGDNSFFLLSPSDVEEKKLPIQFLKPILPSPRHLKVDKVKVDKVKADSDGFPILDKQLYLLDCNLQEKEIQDNYFDLWLYLEQGKQKKVNERHLCKTRSLWYFQEQRPAAPIVCTYMGRAHKEESRPFRFILNESKATSANSYLMLYPREKLTSIAGVEPSVYEEIWRVLNKISSLELINGGRVHGGGLHKLEPKELGNIMLDGDPRFTNDFAFD